MKKIINISPTAQIRPLWAGINRPNQPWPSIMMNGSDSLGVIYKLVGWNPNPIHFLPFFLSLPDLLLPLETHTRRKRKGWTTWNGGRPCPASAPAVPGEPRALQGPARGARAPAKARAGGTPAPVAAPSRTPRGGRTPCVGGLATPAPWGPCRPRQAVAWPCWSGAMPAPARLQQDHQSRSSFGKLIWIQHRRPLELQRRLDLRYWLPFHSISVMASIWDSICTLSFTFVFWIGSSWSVSTNYWFSYQRFSRNSIAWMYDQVCCFDLNYLSPEIL